MRSEAEVAGVPHDPFWDDEDYFDDGDDDEGYCVYCDGEGWVSNCCDDLCQGDSGCIHGDNVICPECHGRYL